MNRDIDQTNVTVVGVRRLSRKAQFWWCVLDISTVGLSLKLEDVRTMSMTATEGFGMVELKLFGDHGALASVKVMSPVAEKVYDWFDARLK